VAGTIARLLSRRVAYSWLTAGVFRGILAGVGGERTDFFISHAGADRAWAEWVAWQLTDAGAELHAGDE
jgi:hypothetical protein